MPSSTPTPLPPKRRLLVGLALVGLALRRAEAMFYVVVEPVRASV